MKLGVHLRTLPADLAKALETTFAAATDHFLQEEWDDAQVDAGRFCEAVLRYLQWKHQGTFTPIDGKSKPNRKNVVSKVQQDTSLPPSLRAQVPQSIELIMDFRNNRNSAHLGDIDANRLDAGTVMNVATWVMSEIIRLETDQASRDVQRLLDEFAEPYVPLVQHVGDTPTVLDAQMAAGDKALVLLYQAGGPVAVATLQLWAEYGNSTRWRKSVLADLAKRKHVLLKDGEVHLLNPGKARAQQLLLDAH